MNASQYRNTQFEFLAFFQGPNSFGVRMSERDKVGEPVNLDVPEGDFSPEEMVQVQTVLEMLETKAAKVYAAHVAKPEDLKATINAAAEAAKQLEELKAQIAAAKAELDNGTQ